MENSIIKAILENLEAQNVVMAELHQMFEELRSNKAVGNER